VSGLAGSWRVVVVLLLLELLMVVEVLVGGSRVLVGGTLEAVGAGRLVGEAGGDAAAGRRLVTRAAATPTITPRISVMTTIGTSGRLALHHGRPGVPLR
jgi:hypothetical protein